MRKQSSLKFIALSLGLVAVLPLATRAADYTWNGGGVNDSWSTSGNWSSLPPSDSAAAYVLHFAGSTRLTPNNDFAAYTQFQQILFDSGASSFTLGGNVVKLYNWGGTAKVENNSSNLQTVGFNTGGFSLDFAGNGELDPTQGDLTISGGVIMDSNGTLSVYGNNGHVLTLNGAISNGASSTGNFQLMDNNIVVFNAANSYTGFTNINAGELRIGSSGSINGSSSIYLGNGGTNVNAQLTLAGTGGGQSISNTFTINATNAGATDYTKRIIAGNNTTGTNTFNGTITVNNDASLYEAAGGTLAFGLLQNGSTVRTVHATGSGTIVLQGSSDNLNIALAVDNGTVQLAKASSSSVHAVGNASGTALTINSGGTAQLGGTGGDQIYNSSNVVISGGTFDINSRSETVNAVTFNGVGGSITGTTGTLTANGALRVSNGTATIAGGTFTTTAFNFVGDTASQTGVVSVASGATLNFNNVNGGGLGYASAASGVIYNSGAFTAKQLYMSDTSNNSSYGYLRNTGTMTIDNSLQIGRNNNANLLDIVGGTTTITTAGNGALTLGSGAGSTSGLNISNGGTFTLGTANQQYINQGAGAYTSINITGAGSKLINPSGGGFDLMKTGNAGNVTTISLSNGGELDTQYMFNNNTTYGANVVNFDNGTLKATGSDGNGLIHLNTAVYIYSGGATIDTNGTTSKIDVGLLAPTGNGVTNITLGGTATGYVGAPIVKITGGGGQGAAAIANFDPTTGTITGITITSKGSDYTSAPTVTLVGGNGGATGAGAGTATATASIAAVTGGGLTKTGAGTLTLSAANTYSGNTTIHAGTLSLGSAASFNSSPVITVGDSGSSGTVLDLTAKASGFHILSGQTVAGIGTITMAGGQTLTVDSGAHWAPGNSIGTNAVTGNLTLSGSSDFQLGNSTGAGTHASPYNSDRTNVSGTLTLGGTLNATSNAGADGNGSAAAGAYLIFTQSGTPSGSFAVINAIGSGASVLHPVVNTATAGSTFLDVYRLAAATAPSSSVNLGNVHVGTTLTGSASVANSASNDGFSELLKATVTGSGTGFSGVAGGSSGTINYSLGTVTAGTQTGSATVVLASTGAGTFGDTTLSTTNVSLSGAAYNLAAAAGSQTVNVGAYHVGVGASTGVTITNTAPVDATYTETLQSNGFSGTSANFTASGAVSGIAGGGSGSGTLSVGAGAGLGAGVQSGSTTLALQSNEVNGSGLGTTNIGSQTVTITGTGYRYADPSAHTPEPVNFGVVHQGATATQALSITNNAANDGFSEKLNASIGSATGDATTNAGSFNLLAAGSTDNSSLVAGISTATGGVKSGQATIALVSDGTGTSGLGTTTLASQTVNVTGQVFNGNATWTGVGSTWGSGASGNWVDSNNINAAPGTFGASFDNVDSGTFDNSGTANTTVNLSGVAPSLKAVTFNSSASYTIAGGSDTLTMKSNAGNATITDSNGSHTISAGVNLASDTTVDVVNSADTLTTMGGINGIKGLVKTGAGTLNVQGANGYTGATTVNAGTLAAQDSLTSAISVNAGTLTGNGSTTGAVVIGDGAGGHDAFLSPGNNGVGTFTTASSLTLNSDATYAFTLDSTSAAANKVVANGVSIDPLAMFAFSDIGDGSGVFTGNVFTIIDNMSGSAISGTFANLAQGATILSNGITYTANYFGGTGNDLVLTASITAVPEPATYGALAGLVLTCLSLTSLIRRCGKRAMA